jgi:hypothetical protein
LILGEQRHAGFEFLGDRLVGPLTCSAVVLPGLEALAPARPPLDPRGVPIARPGALLVVPGNEQLDLLVDGLGVGPIMEAPGESFLRRLESWIDEGSDAFFLGELSTSRARVSSLC